VGRILVRNVGTITKIVEAMAADKEMTAKEWVRCSSRIRDQTIVKITRTPNGGKKKMRWL